MLFFSKLTNSESNPEFRPLFSKAHHSSCATDSLYKQFTHPLCSNEGSRNPEGAKTVVVINSSGESLTRELHKREREREIRVAIERCAKRYNIRILYICPYREKSATVREKKENSGGQKFHHSFCFLFFFCPGVL